VRAKQPDHVYDSGKSIFSSKDKLSSGDLCLVKRVDCNKCLIGRMVQFTYFTGNRRQRQFSNDFVDFSKDSVNNIGVFANWFSAVSQSHDERFEESDFILFKSIDVEFTCGYIAADCFMATIDKTVVMDAPIFSFSIPCSTVNKNVCQSGVIHCHLIYEIYAIVSFDVCIGLPRGCLIENMSRRDSGL